MESYRPAQVATEEVGHVIETADGIAHIEGLPGTMANELLRFDDGTRYDEFRCIVGKEHFQRFGDGEKGFAAARGSGADDHIERTEHIDIARLIVRTRIDFPETSGDRNCTARNIEVRLRI